MYIYFRSLSAVFLVELRRREGRQLLIEAAAVFFDGENCYGQFNKEHNVLIDA